jgi:NTE family protein
MLTLFASPRPPKLSFHPSSVRDSLPAGKRLAALLLGFATILFPAALRAQAATPDSTAASAAKNAGNSSTQKPTPPASDQAGDSKIPAAPPSVPPAIAPAPPPAKPVGRPSIGLALGGGSAPAMSEIGVLQWFEEHHIPVDMIAGTSMGCMVSALYSTGTTVDQLKTVMNDEVFNSVFRFQSAYTSRSFRRREDSRDLPNALTIGLRHGVSLRNSLLTDQGLNDFLDRQFLRYEDPAGPSDRTDFNSLPIPLRCLATDLTDAKTVTFARGSLADAVRASISLPGVYRPVSMNGHEFVDGGVLENLPTQTIQAMHADVILAVSLPLEPAAHGSLDSLVGVLARSFSVAIEADERRSRALANVVIMPDVSGFGTTDYLKSPELEKRGYAAAEAHKDELLRYAVSDAEWQQYVTARAERRRGPLGPLLHLRITYKGANEGDREQVNPNDSLTRAVRRRFEPLLGHPVDTVAIDKMLNEIRADGRYDADYSVAFDSPEAAEANRPSILVTLADKQTGPPFLLAGANVEGQTAGVTRATIEGILLNQDLGGYGSELRSHIKLGFLTEVSSEYYRTLPNLPGLPSGNLFLAPRAGILREPFYLYQNQKRLDERQLQNAGGGLDLGWGNHSTAELRVGWEMNSTRWQTLVGPDSTDSTLTAAQGGPNLTGSMQRARVQFTYDNEDRALVPQFGLHSVTRIGYLYDALGSPDAPEFTTSNTYAHQIGNNLFLMGAQAGTLLNRNVAEPFRFTLGGPFRLSASAIDEYRGTDYFLLSPSFLRRIASLPAPLGQSLYVALIYEAGQMYAPHTMTITRQDALFGIVAETPLGVITLAPSIGDSGHRKFVSTLGRAF